MASNRTRGIVVNIDERWPFAQLVRRSACDLFPESAGVEFWDLPGHATPFEGMFWGNWPRRLANARRIALPELKEWVEALRDETIRLVVMVVFGDRATIRHWNDEGSGSLGIVDLQMLRDWYRRHPYFANRLLVCGAFKDGCEDPETIAAVRDMLADGLLHTAVFLGDRVGADADAIHMLGIRTLLDILRVQTSWPVLRPSNPATTAQPYRLEIGRGGFAGAERLQGLLSHIIRRARARRDEGRFEAFRDLEAAVGGILERTAQPIPPMIAREPSSPPTSPSPSEAKDWLERQRRDIERQFREQKTVARAAMAEQQKQLVSSADTLDERITGFPRFDLALSDNARLKVGALLDRVTAARRTYETKCGDARAAIVGSRRKLAGRDVGAVQPEDFDPTRLVEFADYEDFIRTHPAQWGNAGCQRAARGGIGLVTGLGVWVYGLMVLDALRLGVPIPFLLGDSPVRWSFLGMLVATTTFVLWLQSRAGRTRQAEIWRSGLGVFDKFRARAEEVARLAIEYGISAAAAERLALLEDKLEELANVDALQAFREELDALVDKQIEARVDDEAKRRAERDFDNGLEVRDVQTTIVGMIERFAADIPIRNLSVDLGTAASGGLQFPSSLDLDGVRLEPIFDTAGSRT